MSALLRLALVLALLSGCSLRQAAIDGLGDALAQSGAVFSSDEDPELIRAAAPFSLKLIESVLAERPRHPGLLLAAARGFTQYTYAFVQQEAEEAEELDLAHSKVLQARACLLYRRARDYGLRGLAVASDDVALLYWTAAAWGALIGLSKDDPELLAQLPQARALLERALARDEAFERGALHVLMIAMAPERARSHFSRAMALSAGADAAPLLALAEAVSLPQQRRGEFERLLRQALRIELQPGERRLANLLAQRRARWLLSRTDQLFLPCDSHAC
jgi:predicted anti-sigma-YlaC factor YlaD